VQLDDAVRAAGLVQSVHVLGDDPVQAGQLLQPRHGPVAGVRPGVADGAPAEVAAGPVAPPGDRIAGESLVSHRGGAPGRAGRTAVVRDAGIGGQAGAAEHDHAAVAGPLGELFDLRHPPMVPHSPEWDEGRSQGYLCTDGPRTVS
jgi:hypothetical protein